MSYTKPLSTPLFCYNEVIWSHYIKKYFYKSGVECKLAICHGITDEQPKYSEKGIVVENYLTEKENFHYENIRLICKNDQIIRLAPPVDNEFSMNFIYADDANKHTFYTNLFSYSLVKPKVLNQNLKYIVEHYPDVCNEFIASLELFNDNITRDPMMISSNNFNKMIYSEEYQIHCARIKDKDELKAEELTRSIKSQQIDYAKFNQQLNQEIIENNYLIKTITNRFIQKTN